jgi:hypothetical protein
MDLLESCFPYALLRNAYHAVYRIENVWLMWRYFCFLTCLLQNILFCILGNLRSDDMIWVPDSIECNPTWTMLLIVKFKAISFLIFSCQIVNKCIYINSSLYLSFLFVLHLKVMFLLFQQVLSPFYKCHTNVCCGPVHLRTCYILTSLRVSKF